MIPLSRLNGDHIAINPDRIERADVTPDVVLTMTDGSKYVVAESLDELIDRIRFFRASVLALSQQLLLDGDTGLPGHLRLVRGGPGGTVVDHSGDLMSGPAGRLPAGATAFVPPPTTTPPVQPGITPGTTTG